MSKSTFDESTFEALLGRCIRSATKLELRDSYITSDPPYLEWQATGTVDGANAYSEWVDIARATVNRGVTMRRVRIVSEPLSQYIRFEHTVTDSVNAAPGELIRWLPRQKARDLLLPANDVWIFDDQFLFFNYFSGDSDFLGGEYVDDPIMVKNCVSAFESAWERGIDHKDYELS